MQINIRLTQHNGECNVNINAGLLFKKSVLIYKDKAGFCLLAVTKEKKKLFNQL